MKKQDKKLIRRMRSYASVIEGIIVVSKKGEKYREPRETLMEGARILERTLRINKHLKKQLKKIKDLG